MKNIEFNGLTCFNVNLKVGRSPLSDGMKYLVLESDPDPDYYSKNNFPPNKEHVGDRHLYLLVKNHINCFQDLILRNNKKLQQKFNNKMRVSPGYMTFQNKDIPCVRINASDAVNLPFLVSELKDLGLKLMKDQRVRPCNSLIHFKKYIEFEKIEDGVYQETENPHRFYFKIDKHLDYDEFLEGMEKIKHSCNFHLFDSFLADMYYNNDTLNFIGIYSKDCDKNRFGELKEKIREQF